MHALRFLLIWLLAALQYVSSVAVTEEVKNVRVGEHFEIRLRSNPTTGFSWQLEGRDKTDSFPVSLVVSSYEPDEPLTNNLSPIGLGGSEVFEFKAKEAGTFQLNLRYQRPWEHDIEPLRHHTVEVHVV